MATPRYRSSLATYAAALFAAGTVFGSNPAGAQEAAPAAQPAPPPAQSDPGQVAHECAASYEQAQKQRADGKFLEASVAAQSCSNLQCNSLIVQECIKLFEQIRQDTPSFVFSAHSPKGDDLVQVRVSIDGKIVAEKLDGIPIELNPGVHNFRFEKAGEEPLEIKNTARVGDRNRLFEVTIGKAPPPEVAGTVPGAPPHKAHIPVASYVLGGVGVLGLGAFTYLRLKGTSDYNGMSESCSPRCSPDDVDAVRTKFQLSYVGLGVGLAGLGSAALVYVLSNHSGSPSNTEVGFAPTPGGMHASWRTRF